MPRKSKKEIIKGLDHAFELALILMTVISGILVQFVATEEEIKLPPIISNMPRLSIVFIFPSILTILTWIATYFIDNETQKMRLRTYAWSSITFLALLEVFELYVLCTPPNFPEWINDTVLVVFVLGVIVFPFIPVLFVKKILNRYRTVLKDIDFFSRKGRLATLLRYTPFLLSYMVFWLTFYGATTV